MAKVWWFQIESAQRGYQGSQWLPKGAALRPLAGCCQHLMWNHHTCVLAPWPGASAPRS